MGRYGCVLLLGMLIAGCASVPMAPPALDEAAKQFRPPPGQAHIYIVFEGRGRGASFTILVDGTIRGALVSKTYLVVAVPPGKHTVYCFTPESQSTQPVMVEAGGNYFVKLYGKLGWMHARAALEPMEAAEGRALVQEYQLAAGMEE